MTGDRLTGPFAKTVSALTACIVHERCDAEGTHVPTVTRFVLEQHGRMPDFLRLPIRVATLGFAAFTILHTGRVFHAASHEQRRRQLAWWRRAPIGPCRDLVRFYENLIVYGWFADVEAHGGS